jgi:hypothetical protein
MMRDGFSLAFCHNSEMAGMVRDSAAISKLRLPF